MDKGAVLVTGGSGTVGTQVCRLLREYEYRPISLIRNAARQLEVGNGVDFVVGNVNDYHDLACAMREFKVIGVIHCAANKHISLCERQPVNCVEDNIIGTLNVLRAVEAMGPQIKRAVFISTDKAAKHFGVYGMSKYIGERMVREFGIRLAPKVNSIRMGNIFGSSGSVLPIWHRLISRGEDITLRQFNGNTPERFGMTPWQAGDLIMHVFENPDMYKRGSVVFPECPIINIETLAKVMTENNDSKILVEDLNEGEMPFEYLCSFSELMNTQHIVDNIYEIRDEINKEFPKDLANSTRRGIPVGFDETKVFYFNVIKQLGL